MKFLVAEKRNLSEIDWRMCDVYGKASFSLKNVYNGLDMALQVSTGVEKTVYGVETHWLSGKEKVTDAAVSKEGHTGHEMTHHYRFSWKRFNCKQCFLLPTPNAKFTLFIEYPSYIPSPLALVLKFITNTHIHTHTHIYFHTHTRTLAINIFFYTHSPA